MSCFIRNLPFNSMLAALFATVVLSACGGGASPELEAMQSQSRMAAFSTLGVPPPDHTFGNFNPQIWNDHSWYECNCGRDPDKPPVATPFDEAN